MKFTAVSAVVAAAAFVGVSSASHNEPSVPSGLVRRHHSKYAAHALEKRSFSGKATYYGVNPGDMGACGTTLQAGDYFVALNQDQYGSLNAKSSYCFKTITITNGVKTAQAKILDACPKGEQCHWGALDMSKALFSYFNDFGVGVFDITWWVGSGDGPSSSGSSSGGSSSSSKSNNDDNSNDNSDNSDNQDDNKKEAARLAQKKEQDAADAKKKAEEAAQEKKDEEEAAAEKAKKEKAKKKKEAAKKKKEKAIKDKKEKAAQRIHEAQSQNIAAFGEIMQTLNKMVESAQTNDNGSAEKNGNGAAVAAAASAGSSSSSLSASSSST